MMTVDALVAAHPTKLTGVHPVLLSKLVMILAAMADIGYPMTVTDGLRTAAQQQALYAQGRTAPGPEVTRADGVNTKSNHQARDDGFGHAVDCAFVDANGAVDWNTMLPWSTYGKIAQALGLVWGGAWPAPQIVDRPHIELP